MTRREQIRNVFRLTSENAGFSIYGGMMTYLTFWGKVICLV